MLSALIIDDEARSRNVLQQLLHTYCPEVNVVGQSDNLMNGIEIIKRQQPAVVFLDVELSKHSGFQLFEHFEDRNFEVVLVTAHESYAIEAFRQSVAAYLLKPINIDQLIIVVNRLLSKKQFSERQKPGGKSSSLNRIHLPTLNGKLYLELDQIVFLESEGRYTHIHLSNREILLTTLPLKNLEELLEAPYFQRIHRSHIINLLHVQRYAKGRESGIFMETGAELAVGKKYKETLSKMLSVFTQ